MSLLNIILIFAAAYLTVFGQAALPGLRHLLNAQVDLLPIVMVYAALNTNLIIVALLAVFSGLWFDALSANPLGVSVLPLFVVGFVILLQRDLILRGLPFAQMVLGTIACATVPVLAVLILLTIGRPPLLGWGSLWQWLVMTAGGAAMTPMIFALFNWLNRSLGYQPRKESSFRPDREILRGRN